MNEEDQESIAKTNQLLKILEEAELLKQEGTRIFTENPQKNDQQLIDAREKYLKSSEKLVTRSTDFVVDPAVKNLYMDGMKSALMNASMMSLKLKDFEKSVETLKYAKQFFSQSDDTGKLDYRLAASYNGLQLYKEALEVLEGQKNSKDPLVKLEFNKAYNALKKDKKATEKEKDTYAKMFNPDTRKEIAKQRKEEKVKQKEEETQQSEGSIVKYLVGALAVAGIGYLVYKNVNK
jgi:hypothetical protein